VGLKKEGRDSSLIGGTGSPIERKAKKAREKLSRGMTAVGGAPAARDLRLPSGQVRPNTKRIGEVKKRTLGR